MGGVADPNIHVLHRMCYHVKFDSSATKDVRTYRKEPEKNWEHWDPALLARGLADYLKAILLPIHVTTSNLVVLRQRVRVNKRKPQN